MYNFFMIYASVLRKKVFANTNFYQILVFIDAKIGTNHVFLFQKVFTNTIFYQILVFGDTNISIKIIHVSVPPGRNCRTYRFACLLPHL